MGKELQESSEMIMNRFLNDTRVHAIFKEGFEPYSKDTNFDFKITKPISFTPKENNLNKERNMKPKFKIGDNVYHTGYPFEKGVVKDNTLYDCGRIIYKVSFDRGVSNLTLTVPTYEHKLTLIEEKHMKPKFNIGTKVSYTVVAQVGGVTLKGNHDFTIAGIYLERVAGTSRVTNNYLYDLQLDANDLSLDLVGIPEKELSSVSSDDWWGGFEKVTEVVETLEPKFKVGDVVKFDHSYDRNCGGCGSAHIVLVTKVFSSGKYGIDHAIDCSGCRLPFVTSEFTLSKIPEPKFTRGDMVLIKSHNDKDYPDTYIVVACNEDIQLGSSYNLVSKNGAHVIEVNEEHLEPAKF